MAARAAATPRAVRAAGEETGGRNAVLAAVGDVVNALLTRTGLAGAALEATWMGLHLGLYPLGLLGERASDRRQGYRLEHLTTDRTRSDLESLFLNICRRYAIPLPEVNVKLGRWTVDFLWRDQRLVIETDGWKAHRGRQAFEDDRARDAFLKSLGYEVLRFTWRQLEQDSASVLLLLRRYLRPAQIR